MNHAVCHKFGPKLASHYKPVENEVKFGLSEPYSANYKFNKETNHSASKCPKYVWRTNIRLVKNGLKAAVLFSIDVFSVFLNPLNDAALVKLKVESLKTVK